MYGQFPVSVFKGGDSSENLAKHMKPIVDMEHDVERCFLDPLTLSIINVVFVHASDLKGMAALLGSHSSFRAIFSHPLNDECKKDLFSNEVGKSPFYIRHPVSKDAHDAELKYTSNLKSV